MSMRDFNDWLQFYQQCGLPHTNAENLLARQAWQFACANSGKGSKPKLADFLPRKPSTPKAMTKEDLQSKLRGTFAALGIKPDGQRDRGAGSD